MSGGWSSAESRIRNLGKKSKAIVEGNQVSVVFYDPESDIIDWPEYPNQNGGCLVVPRPVSESEWIEKYGQHGK